MLSRSRSQQAAYEMMLQMMPQYILVAVNPKYWPFGQDVDSHYFTFLSREAMIEAYHETKQFHPDLFFFAYVIRPKLMGNHRR